MKIDFLIVDNLYQSTVHFSREFSRALKKRGVKTRCFRIGKNNFYRILPILFQDPPDFTCSFSDITIGEGVPLGDQWNIPHISFLIDPAIYFLHQLRGSHSWVTCVDRDDCAFIKQLGFSRVAFLPHGASKVNDIVEERPLDLIFFGTCIDYLAIEEQWKVQLTMREQRLLKEAADLVLSNNTVSCLKALSEAGLNTNTLFFHQQLDSYIRGKDRIELLKSMEGLGLHVWGKGPWKKYLKRTQIHKPVRYSTLFTILEKAKILLNSSPRFKNGSHERIFQSLAHETLVVTGENPYIKESFCDGDSILTYPHGEWITARQKVEDVLNDQSYRQLAQKGKAIVDAFHTWDQRADSLLHFLKTNAIPKAEVSI
jgi:spore maturation protein CgeB